MGCITGMVAKIFLTAFNVCVALTGVAVLSMCAVVSTQLNSFDPYIPQESWQVLVGLESTSGFVICLGVLGMLVACCCDNKLFLYTYFALGGCLVVTVLTFSIMGVSNADKYKSQVEGEMMKDIPFYFNGTDDYQKLHDDIYSTNECCGVKEPEDWENAPNKPLTKPNKLPSGCCLDYPAVDVCNLGDDGYHKIGCYERLGDDVAELADATMKLGIFFGVFLFALILSTCVCTKCTDAMPI